MIGKISAMIWRAIFTDIILDVKISQMFLQPCRPIRGQCSRFVRPR